MSNVIEEIAIRVGADIGPLQSGMKKASESVGGLRGVTQRTGDAMQKFGSRMQNLGKNMSYVSGAIVVAAGSAFALARSTANAGDAIAKTARGAGVGAEMFQEYSYALGQVAGLSQEELGSALSRLTKLIGDAENGAKGATATLIAMGYSLEDIQSGALTTEQVFERYIEAMDGADSATEAASLSAELFGRANADLGPKLMGAGDAINDLRQEARDLGLVMGEDTLDASEEFNDALDRVMKTVGALRNRIGAALLPVLVNSLIPALEEKVIPALITMVGHIENVISWFGQLPGPVQEAAGVIGAALGVGGPVLLAIGTMSRVIGALIAASGPVGLLITAATLLAVAWAKWGDDIIEAVGGAVEWVTEKFNGFLEYIRAIPAQMLQIGQDMIQGLIDGLMAKWEDLKARVFEMANALPEWMRDLLGIHSPSLVFHEIGQHIGEGLALGIEDSFGMVQQAVSGMAGMAADTMAGYVGDILGSLSTLFNGSKVFAVAQALVNTYQGITEALKLPYPLSMAASAAVAARGFAAVASIKSTRPGSGGGGGGASAPAAAAAPAPRPLEVRLSGMGANDLITGSALGQLLDNLSKEAGDRGYRLMVAR